MKHLRTFVNTEWQLLNFTFRFSDVLFLAMILSSVIGFSYEWLSRHWIDCSCLGPEWPLR